MITDSHCHLASHRFSKSEISDLVDRARSAGVHRMVTLATCLENVAENLEISSRPEVRTALGIHPCDVHHAPDDAVEKIARYMADPRVCAVGETGLDYFHPAPEGWKEEDYRCRQREFLRQHFQLAVDCGLNVVVHTRDIEGDASFADALEIYKPFSNQVRAVFHCFISPWAQAEKVLALGGLVSFGGVSTFKKSQLIRDAARQCPAGSFMLETDSPYLAPEPLRGQRNEPAYTCHIAKVLAEARGESIEELASHTDEAASKFFHWVM